MITPEVTDWCISSILLWPKEIEGCKTGFVADENYVEPYYGLKNPKMWTSGVISIKFSDSCKRMFSLTMRVYRNPQQIIMEFIMGKIMHKLRYYLLFVLPQEELVTDLYDWN